ncbi:hypothetical protein [uncultured Clostridium sp.]|uniref:hypothetical protein n=1 Tax=uncultured Clostridium sp. TaxID=59620 RepID=UPI0025FE5F9E|nr:hypothetical protein [uncultured Clostridium sp.]
MHRIKKIGVISLICCLILGMVIFTSHSNLYGKWYLYTGNDINTDSNISKQINSKDYIEISKGTIETFRSDGKNGISEMKVLGRKIQAGDAVYKYDIKNNGEYKILVLELIGYENPNMKKIVENGEKFIYVLDKNVDL